MRRYYTKQNQQKKQDCGTNERAPNKPTISGGNRGTDRFPLRPPNERGVYPLFVGGE